MSCQRTTNFISGDPIFAKLLMRFSESTPVTTKDPRCPFVLTRSPFAGVRCGTVKLLAFFSPFGLKLSAYAMATVSHKLERIDTRRNSICAVNE